ncbi:MAG: hypothetical protein ACLRNW_11565 [Neglectibacter sp.]
MERLKTESKSPLGFQNKDDTPETDDLGKWDRTVVASGVMTAAFDILDEGHFWKTPTIGEASNRSVCLKGRPFACEGNDLRPLFALLKRTSRSKLTN